MMSHQDCAHIYLAALHKKELDGLEAMARAGVTVAIPAAMDYCVKHGVNPPAWLLATATELLCSLIRREKSARRGRSCGHVARYRQDMIDFQRWGEVDVVRQKQREILKQVEELRAIPNAPRSMLEEREKMLAWAGRSLNRAFECAAMKLEASQAYAGPDAIKASYFRVERNSRDPKKALRYHVLDAGFLRKIGIKHEIEYRPGRKKVPLYELTI
jgi:hypothetical protein